MGSNCCKGDAPRPLRSSSIYSRSRAGAALEGRFKSSQEGGALRLTVSAARTDDTGLYTLQASNAAGSDTARVRLEVAADEAPTGDDPPTFLRRLQDLTVKVGTRTRFLVEILSSTECKVTWYRNERRLLEAERVSLARDGNFWCADVAAVSVDDAGRWTCTAENAGGRASCSAHLNVLVPKAYKRPEFVEELRALLTELGTVSLECKVVGVPTPVLRWFKDSREIKAGDVFALTANAEDPTSLGTYTCEAVNCMGRAYSSSKVHVVGRASREGSTKPAASGFTGEPPPIFTRELEDQFARICEPLTLSCQVVVPPWPRSVVWYNKEGKVEPSERYHVLEDGVGGYMLEIPSAEWADEGEWKCVATSSGGRVGISTCIVSMDVPKNYRKPRFMENLQAVLTEEGLVSFECKVVGFPTPVLSWFKDGQELKPGDVYQLTGTNSLGSYCCIAKNCMGQASSSAELTVEDIQNQLNEEEKLQLFSKNQAPKFVQGLKSVESKIDEPFRFTVKVAIPPEPSVLWYRDDQPVDESTRCHLGKEERGVFFLDIQNLEFLDQAEWKCVAMNDFGHSVTSCFLKLIIPRHYKKPRFLENLQAILSDEGAVNLECKVIGVPQPVLKWYKDGEELKPGDIHRIISGQDGTCCLGTYTCEASNCMGVAASSASLLGFEDSMKAKEKKKAEEQALQRNLSLSTIHEERTSQMYDTPVGDITLDDKGEISFSFDGKEVSVSLYETPDLTEEEALQIVEMYADQLSENVTEHNVVELPPLRFVKETSTSGNLLMEAIIIDVSPEYFTSPEEDLRTEADVDDISIADENGPPQLSLDQDVDIAGEDYLEKTMALLSEERIDAPLKLMRKKSDSQRSADDFFSLSREQSLSEEKKDDDTQALSESELHSFASAHSLSKPKSKSSKPSAEDGHESSEPSKTILFKDEVRKSVEGEVEPVVIEPAVRPKREHHTSRGSRRSSSGSEKSQSRPKEKPAPIKTQIKTEAEAPKKPSITDEEFKTKMSNISSSLTKVITDVQLIERDIILKSELMSSAATASRSLEIISSLITPLSEIHSIADAAQESAVESKDVSSTLFNSLPQSLKSLHQSLTIIEKCIDVESDNRTLVKRTCVSFIETCGAEIQKLTSEIKSIVQTDYLNTEDKVLSDIESVTNEMSTVIKFSADTIKARNLLSEASEIKVEEPSVQTKHLRDTQKAVFELRSPLNSLLRIAESADSGNIVEVSKIKSSDVILNDMSASIQDLQISLEQIESLSVKESTTPSLQKYNTQIIETVVETIMNLRSAFEQLSTDKRVDDKTALKETLKSIRENLNEISTQIGAIETNVGTFDVLQSDNKLDVLQKMAQILITLENNLPRLETMPEVKTHMESFHKNLTKVLENVIESNEAKKYFTLMEICDAVNRMNSSIKDIDIENVLPLASISNTLNIIKDNFVNNVFDSELNCSVLTNITDVLIGIQEAINKAEEVSYQVESEHVQDLSAQAFDATRANVVIEHIDQTIAAINTVRTIETTIETKINFAPVLENICPVLEDLRKYIATVGTGGVEHDEHISDISEASFAETLATPLCELNQNLIILNQTIVENIESLKENNTFVSAVAEPLHELQRTLEVIQQEVISQYGEDLTPYEISVNMASAVQNLQSCILMIQEQAGVEGVDDMSTLEDISGIKTTAETIPSDRLVLPTAEETTIEQTLEPFSESVPKSAVAQALHTLNDHVAVLQNPEVLDALDTLSEVSDYSSLKSVALGLNELHSGIQEILHPIIMEGSNDILNLVNVSKLVTIAEPLHELQQSLSVLEMNNIPIYENILELPTEKLHSVIEKITEFKEHLSKCVEAIFPAMELADQSIEISNKIGTLREVCEHLKDIIVVTKDRSIDVPASNEVEALEEVVDNLIKATDPSTGIRIEEVKLITQDLFAKVLEVQEELIQFIPQSPDKLAREAKLIDGMDEVEKNIAVLQEHDFVDLSRISDITSCTSPQLAKEIEAESLIQIDNLAANAVNVVQDSSQEMSIADLMIVEDFFKTCRNEFTILRCLITKASSHKKIVRLLQEFSTLQTTIEGFKTKKNQLNLTDDVNGCLVSFLLHAEDCLQNVQNSLIKIVNSQSEILFKEPVTELNNTVELLTKSVADQKEFVEVVAKFVNVVEVTRTSMENIQTDIIKELQQPSVSETSQEHALTKAMEQFTEYIEDQIKIQTNGTIIKNLEELLNCIHKHQDFRDATVTGKVLIIQKCLSNCADILQETILGHKLMEASEHKIEEGALKVVLNEMLEPLQALHSQLKIVQEQVISGVQDDSISIDIESTESLVKTMTEIHKDIVQKIVSEDALVASEELSLIMEVNKEIHAIQHAIQLVESVQATQAVVEVVKPIEDIEKSLQEIFSSDKLAIESKEKLSKEKAAVLVQHIDQYIELIEIVEEISAVIKIEDLKETVDIAKELRASISSSDVVEIKETGEMKQEISAEQARLALKLQRALISLHVQVFDNAQELAPELSAEVLQRIAKVTAQLQADLVAVTGVHVAVQAPSAFMIETVKSDEVADKEKLATLIPTDAAVKETVTTVLEQVGVMEPSAQKGEATVELLEKESIELQQIEAAIEVQQLEEKVATEDGKLSVEANESQVSTSSDVIDQVIDKTSEIIPAEKAALQVTEKTVAESGETVAMEDITPISAEIPEAFADVVMQEQPIAIDVTEPVVEEQIEEAELTGPVKGVLAECKDITEDTTSLLTEEVQAIIAESTVAESSPAEEISSPATSKEADEVKAENIPSDKVATEADKIVEEKLQISESVVTEIVEDSKVEEIAVDKEQAKVTEQTSSEMQESLTTQCEPVQSNEEVVTKSEATGIVELVADEIVAMKDSTEISKETAAIEVLKHESVVTQEIVADEDTKPVLEVVPAICEVETVVEPAEVSQLIPLEEAIKTEEEKVKPDVTEVIISEEAPKDVQVAVVSEEVKISVNKVAETSQLTSVEQTAEDIKEEVVEEADISKTELLLKEEAKPGLDEALSVAVTSEATSLLTEIATEAEKVATEAQESKVEVVADEKEEALIVEHPVPVADILKSPLDELVHHMEELVSENIVETLQELSNATVAEALKTSITTAKELKESIETLQPDARETSGEIKVITAEETKLAQQLQIALSVIHQEVLDSLKDVSDANKDNLQKILKVTETLKADLIAVAHIEEVFEVVQDPISQDVKEGQAIISEQALVEVTPVVSSQEAEIIGHIEATKEKIVETVEVKEKIKDETKERTEPVPVIAEQAIAETKYEDNHEVLQEKKDEVLQSIAVSNDAEPVKFEVVTVDKPVAVISEQAKATSDDALAKASVEHSLIQHIDELISNEVCEAIENISLVTSNQELKVAVVAAKELRECVAAVSTNVEEESGIVPESGGEKAQLAQKLLDSLVVLNTQILDNAQELTPVIETNTLEKVASVITHLKEDLQTAVVIYEPGVHAADIQKSGDTSEENSMKRLEVLLQEVNEKIDLASPDRNAEDSEALRDTLDEVQTVIIKLKRDYDGAVNDALNETLEDLECSVRSVQLQINEDSPPELLKEACATLQLLLNNMSETQSMEVSQTIANDKKSQTLLDKCSEETQSTVTLLDIACKVDAADHSNLKTIVSDLNKLKETIKALRLNFLSDAQTLIDRGIDITQSLDQVEDRVYSLEKDIDNERKIAPEIRDCIITAIHSVFGSISSMRGTISSIQKRYMFENYGKPSEMLLRTIKNVSDISKSDKEVNKPNWQKFSKSLRKILNHFEDVKFYINLDKTARLPSDAAFTKIILQDLKSCMNEVILTHKIMTKTEGSKKVEDALKCVEKYMRIIEPKSTLDVKEKIPILKDIAAPIYEISDFIKNTLLKAEVQEVAVELEQATEVKTKLFSEILDEIVDTKTLDKVSEQESDQAAKQVASQEIVAPISTESETKGEIIAESTKKAQELQTKIEEVSEEIVQAAAIESYIESSEIEKAMSTQEADIHSEAVMQVVEAGVLHEAEVVQFVSDVSLDVATVDKLNQEETDLQVEATTIKQQEAVEATISPQNVEPLDGAPQKELEIKTDHAVVVEQTESEINKIQEQTGIIEGLTSLETQEEAKTSKTQLEENVEQPVTEKLEIGLEESKDNDKMGINQENVEVEIKSEPGTSEIKPQGKEEKALTQTILAPKETVTVDKAKYIKKESTQDDKKLSEEASREGEINAQQQETEKSVEEVDKANVKKKKSPKKKSKSIEKSPPKEPKSEPDQKESESLEQKDVHGEPSAIVAEEIKQDTVLAKEEQILQSGDTTEENQKSMKDNEEKLETIVSTKEKDDVNEKKVAMDDESHAGEEPEKTKKKKLSKKKTKEVDGSMAICRDDVEKEQQKADELIRTELNKLEPQKKGEDFVKAETQEREKEENTGLTQQKSEKDIQDQNKQHKENEQISKSESEKAEQTKAFEEENVKQRIEKEKLENDVQKKETLEKEGLGKENEESDRIHNEKLDDERSEREKQEKEELKKEKRESLKTEKGREEKEKLENENLQKENFEKNKLEIGGEEEKRVEDENKALENERLEKELLEKQKLEKEIIEKDKLEKQRLEKEKFEQDQEEKDKKEKEKLRKEKREQRRKEKEDKERLEKEKLGEENEEKENLEKERLQKEKLEKERLEKEQKIEKEKLEQEQLEKERLENEEREKKRLEEEKLEKDQEDKEKQRKDKREKLKKEKEEKDRLEKEKVEKESEEKVKLEKERLEKEKLKKEEERLEKETLEKERLEHERLAREKLEKERVEKERMEKETLEKERLDKQFEKEKLLEEKLERDKLEKEQVEKQRVENERLEKERLEQEKLEKERLEKEKLEKEKLEKDQEEKEKQEKEKKEKEKLRKEKREKHKKEKEEKERQEKEKLEKENEEKIKLEKENSKKERLEKEKMEQEKQEKEKLAKEQLEKEKLEREKLERDKLEKQQVEKQRLENERLEKERLEQEKLEKERLEKQKLEKDQEEKENQEKEKKEKEKLRKEKREKLKKDREEKERQEKEKVEKESEAKIKLEKEREEKERLEKEKMEQEKQEKEKLEQEKLQRDKLEKEQVEKERVENERIEKEKLEQENLERERLEKEKLEKDQEEKEKQEKEKKEKEKLRKEKREKLKKEKEQKERQEKENEEEIKLEKVRLEKERLEKEKIEQEKQERVRLEKEQLEKEKLEQEKLETDKMEKEQIEKQRVENERLEKERLEQEKLEKEKVEKENLEKEKLQKEQEDKERQEKEKKDKEIARKEKREKLKKEKEEREKFEKDNEEKERLEKEKLEKERLEQEQLEREKSEKETLELEKIQKEGKDKQDKKETSDEEAKDKILKEGIPTREKENELLTKDHRQKDLREQQLGEKKEDTHEQADKDAVIPSEKGTDKKKIIKKKSKESDKVKTEKDESRKLKSKAQREASEPEKDTGDKVKQDMAGLESAKKRESETQESLREESKTTKMYQETSRSEENDDASMHRCERQEDRFDDERSQSYNARERPTFVDRDHRDYTMEFARPSGYRERRFDGQPESFDYLSTNKNATIYKAETIYLDSQLRSPAPPIPDLRSSESGERRELRQKSKALSEARSVASERRTGSRDIKRKPVFSTFLTDRTAVEGSRVKLTCSALSSTEPTITWYRNGVVLDNKLKYRTKFIDGLITLEVLNAVPSDSAEYSCTVEDENGSISTSANLKVYPSFEASPIPPTFTRSIRDTYHLAEDELVLECRIRGQPLPTITWLKEDRLVTSDRHQAYYLADGVCRLAIAHPTPEDSGKYTCKAENSMWSDQITHVVNFTGRESRLSPNLATVERSRFNRHAMESRRPHFENVLTDYQVVKGGTIGLQVEIRGCPTRVEWLREGHSVTEVYRNARTFVEHGLYTLALSDVTEKESGLYTCRAWSTHGNVDMNAAITVVQPNEMDGKPAIIIGRPEKDILISVGEDINISFRVQGEPKPKVIFMKGIRDITTSQRVCKMTSDDYVKFTVKRSVISDAGTYCILARNAYGCDRAFVTVVVRQRASSENLISDWTYPMDDTALSVSERKYKSVPDRVPGEPSVVDGGNNWLSLAWSKPDHGAVAPVLAYKVESWLVGKEGGARWAELGITPLNSFDAFNLKQGEEYHFRVTPRNRYGWGEPTQTSTPVGVGVAGVRPEFVDILPGQLKVLAGETANLSCSVKGQPTPEVIWMKNGHEIEEEDARMATSFNGYDCCLTIKDIDTEHDGRYSCEASNVHGRASTYARLAVVTDRLIWEADVKLKRERSQGVEGEYPPQFTMRLRDRRVQATYPVRLTCQVVGNPPPAVTWYKDGEEVATDNRHNKYQDEHFHTLEIAPTTLEDGGVYEALARNPFGAVSCRCGLVVDKGIRAYVAPEFCCGLEPLYRLNEGEELRISAVVEAYPSVGVTWYRDGVRLRPSRRAVMTLDRDGQIELALAAVTLRDAGVYTCTASNEVGRASTSGKVEVAGQARSEARPPAVVVSPDVPYSTEPMFIRKPRSSEAYEGDTVIIQCEVVGDPKPDVYWLRDFLKPDYYRDASHFKRVGDGPEYRFEIPHAKLDYTGAYSVVARNVHGEAKAVISLQIKVKDPCAADDAHYIRYGRVEVIPRFERGLTDLLSCDGDAVEFECHVTGNPDPYVRWFHYNELIRDCPDFEALFEQGAARLRIKQVTAEDEGTYTCEAANCLGKARTSACLVVYPPGEPNTLNQRLRRPPALLSAASTPRSTPRSTPARSVSRTPGPEPRRLCSPARQMAPAFYTYPFNKVVEEGDSVVFQCAVKGLPAPWATWDKDGIILTPTARVTLKEKDEILRILEIDEVTIEDVGIYRITIENEFGRAEASARLEVITRKGKFYGGLRAMSASPRRSLGYRRRPSTPRQD